MPLYSVVRYIDYKMYNISTSFAFYHQCVRTSVRDVKAFTMAETDVIARREACACMSISPDKGTKSRRLTFPRSAMATCAEHTGAPPIS